MLFFALVFYHSISNEENVLQEKFGAEFSKYKEMVPIFIPSTRHFDSNVLNVFSWQQVKQNKEYKAIIGVLLLAIYLLIKFLIQYNAAAPHNKLLG
jgi:hypothetical protein